MVHFTCSKYSIQRVCVVNNTENGSAHFCTDSMNHRNNSNLQINPFHLMYILEIAQY